MKGSTLVFASKMVGLETLRHVVEAGTNVARVIVANNSDPYNQEIIKMIGHTDIGIEVYHVHTQADLVNLGKTYDWILNLWSPHILKPGVLALAKQRLNIHSGLVPVCRGNDNAAWCIRKGLPAGVALIEMNQEVDCGGVYVQKEVEYSFPTKGLQLHQKLQTAAIELFRNNWLQIYDGLLLPKQQTGECNCFTRKQTEADRSQDAAAVMSIQEWVTWVMAHDFYPGTTAEIRYHNKVYRLRLDITEKDQTGNKS